MSDFLGSKFRTSYFIVALILFTAIRNVDNAEKLQKRDIFVFLRVVLKWVLALCYKNFSPPQSFQGRNVYCA